MAKRAKSATDLYSQMFRIENNPRTTWDRANRASDAFNKYLKNIYNTKSYQAALKKASGSGIGTREAMKVMQIADRKYSQNTYMGINAG